MWLLKALTCVQIICYVEKWESERGRKIDKCIKCKLKRIYKITNTSSIQLFYCDKLFDLPRMHRIFLGKYVGTCHIHRGR